MKIISPFKDYYDFVAGHDPDPRKVYVREERRIDWKDEGASPQYNGSIYIKRAGRRYVRQNSSMIYNLEYVFFCNRAIPVIIERRDGTNVYHYSLDKLSSFDEDYSSGEHTTWYKRKTFKEIFSGCKITDINSRLKSPIYFDGRVNIKLSSISFNNHMLPSEVFTEIYNWIPFNEPELPMGGPDDMIRYQQHGFDKKTSFRNM